MLHGRIRTASSLNNHKTSIALPAIARAITENLNRHISAELNYHPGDTSIMYIKMRSGDKYYSVRISNKAKGYVEHGALFKECDYNLVVSDIKLNCNQVAHNILAHMWRKFVKLDRDKRVIKC